MPDPRDLPLVRWAEDLRRHRLARRASRLRLTAATLAAVAAAALSASLLWPPRPVFLWNGSASSAIGLYRLFPPKRIGRGDLVAAWPPEAARQLAVRRGYLPTGLPLVKRVASVGGDRVCAAGEALFVNGELVARRRSEDRAGRPLPWWTGCVEMADDDLLLLTADRPGSFDGRYFGLTAREDVIGRARLIWAR